ncbi:uncharacterized protein [Nicotiana tomentosiformis]|uniref:uncharacterized protein n=1 Tax=Nicotiana tomentosiformis TaxID=4098 RepID=UPI00388C764D
MVRTRAIGSSEQTPMHIPRVARGRGRGRGRGRARATTRAPVRAAVEEPTVAPVGGQIGGINQTPTARTPEQRVHIGQPEVRPEASEEEQKRFERLKRYSPPTFSGTTTEDAQGFLEKYHRILRTMGIVELNEVAFTTFQLSGAAYQWWQIYEEGRPANATPPTWAQFSEFF